MPVVSITSPLLLDALSRLLRLMRFNDLFASRAPSARKISPPSLQLRRLLELLRHSWLLLLHLPLLLQLLRLLLLLSLLRLRPLLLLPLFTIIAPPYLPREKCGLTPRYLLKGLVAQPTMALPCSSNRFASCALST